MTDASPHSEEQNVTQETAQSEHPQLSLLQSPHKLITAEREVKSDSWEIKGTHPAMFKFQHWSA